MARNSLYILSFSPLILTITILICYIPNILWLLYFAILSCYVRDWSFTFFNKYMTEELVYAYRWNFECVLIFIKMKCRYQSHYKTKVKKIFKYWGTNPQMNFPLKLMKWKGAPFKKWNILYFETLMRNWFKYIFFRFG